MFNLDRDAFRPSHDKKNKNKKERIRRHGLVFS